MAFKPSYAKERVSSNDETTPNFFVPMVSFCDFKVHELNLHCTKYGKFGIGLSKKWGIRKGLNPVFYINDGCNLFGDIRKSLISIDKCNDNLMSAESRGDKDWDLLTKILSNSQKIMDLYCYSKNYQGELERKGKKTIKNFRFADDREWRYVSPNVEFPLYGESKNVTKESLNNAYIRREHFLNFKYENIKFVFVPNKKERLYLINFIDRLPINKDEKHLLISKILVIKHLDLS